MECWFHLYLQGWLQCWYDTYIPESVVEVVMVYANYSIQRRYSGWKMLG
jgi:hypothetical protein